MKSGASEVNSEKCLLRASIVVQRARCLPGPPPAPMSVDAGGKMGPPGAKVPSSGGFVGQRPNVRRQNPANKRLRSLSWDVDVSLEDLVSWDVLEQFMHDQGQTEGCGMGGELMGGGAAPDPPGLGLASLPSPSLGPMRGPAQAPVGAGSVHPGVWPPPLSGPDGYAPSLGLSPGLSPGLPPANLGAGTNGLNAAALAQNLSMGWQLPGPSFPMPPLAQSWGSDFLPSVMGVDDGNDSPSRKGAGRGLGPDDAEPPSGRPVHKQRFVWTASLHQRFEAAVKTLGIDHAKPQAISQLMNCEGDGAPTRQNIKSHLQKYRLMMQKRARAVRHALPPHSSLRHALTPSPVMARRARGLTACAHVAGG